MVSFFKLLMLILPNDSPCSTFAIENGMLCCNMWLSAVLCLLNNYEMFIYSFDEPFEEVIYPKGDSDAVSISKRDVDLLQPDTFINDTIIDFYIK